MQLGDPTAAPSQRGRLDVVLDKLNANLTELIEAVDCGGLDQLDPAAVWISWIPPRSWRGGSASRPSGTGYR